MKHHLILTTLFLAVWPLVSNAQTNTCQTIAHRGYWRCEGSAQNSRASLLQALNMGIFGSEIDIWLTSDGHIMVNHDERFDGVTLQDTTASVCRRLRLSNGEPMPELKQLLRLLRKSNSPTRLIVEVKPHRDPQRSRLCAEKAIKAISKSGLQDRVMYISFSIEACQTIHALQPNAEVAYLSGNRTPAELHQMGITGIDYNIKVLRKHPEWIDEAHRLGMNVNVWTVDKAEDIREMQNLGVDYITTNEPALCDSLLR